MSLTWAFHILRWTHLGLQFPLLERGLLLTRKDIQCAVNPHVVRFNLREDMRCGKHPRAP